VGDLSLLRAVGGNWVPGSSGPVFKAGHRRRLVQEPNKGGRLNCSLLQFGSEFPCLPGGKKHQVASGSSPSSECVLRVVSLRACSSAGYSQWDLVEHTKCSHLVWWPRIYDFRDPPLVPVETAEFQSSFWNKARVCFSGLLWYDERRRSELTSTGWASSTVNLAPTARRARPFLGAHS